MDMVLEHEAFTVLSVELCVLAIIEVEVFLSINVSNCLSTIELVKMKEHEIVTVGKVIVILTFIKKLTELSSIIVIMRRNLDYLSISDID